MNFNFPQDYEVNKYMGYDIVSLTLSTFTAQNGQNVTQGHAPPWIREVLLICPVISTMISGILAFRVCKPGM